MTDLGDSFGDKKPLIYSYYIWVGINIPCSLGSGSRIFQTTSPGSHSYSVGVQLYLTPSDANFDLLSSRHFGM